MDRLSPTKASRQGLIGFSGRWPKVFHAIREGDRSLCSNFTQLHFFYDYAEMDAVNERWAMALTPCRSCFTEDDP